MALDNLEKPAPLTIVDNFAQHIFQDVKDLRDLFLPHNASDLNTGAAKSDKTVGGTLPNCEIQFDANDMTARRDLAPHLTHNNPYEGSDSVLPYSQVNNSDMTVFAARAYELGKAQDQFIKMEKDY